MATVRIIACLDVLDGQVVKGVKFKNHRPIGDPVSLAQRYALEGVDELVFYDIGASPRGRMFDPTLVENIARAVDIPFCVAGGIRSVEDARRAIASGADKISVNSAAIARPGLISEISRELGAQAVVVGVDCLGSKVYRLTGSEATTQATGLDVFDWCREAQERGCGEIVLNCMAADGTKAGAEVCLLSELRAKLIVPVVASGGLGTMEHFERVFKSSGVSAALAASVFHDQEIKVSALKNFLHTSGIEVRL